jgi:hypothetical protein
MSRWISPRWTGMTLRTLALCPGSRCGRLVHETAEQSFATAIVLCDLPRAERADRLLGARGVILLRGPLLSHLSLLLREFGVPTVALSSAAGKEAAAVLKPGSVAFIDGDDGTIHLPGGDAEARKRAAELLDALHDLEEDSTDKHAEFWRDLPIDELEFAWTAVALYDALAPETAQHFESWTRKRLESEAPQILETLLDRLRMRLLERCQRARRVLRETRELESLGPLEDGLIQDGNRDLERLARLDAATADLEMAIRHVRRDITARREATRALLRTEVERASALDDPHWRRNYGDLLRLRQEAQGAGVEQAIRAPFEARLEARARLDTPRGSLVHLVEGGSDEALDRARVGGKAAGLAQLQPHLPGDCRIPAGFIVTTAAYRDFMRGDNPVPRPSSTDEPGAARVAELLSRRPLPAQLVEALERRLAARPEAIWAIRSSSTAEDLPQKSLAGQFQSFLGVRGAEDVRRFVREVWKSGWTPAVLRALAWSGRSPDRMAMAVLIQEWIDAEVAGVLRTHDPTGRSSGFLVNAAYGMGLGISSGEVAGDLFWLHPDGSVSEQVRGNATFCLVRGDEQAQPVRSELSPAQLSQTCLDEARLARLARLGRRLHEAFGCPLDLEFGFGPDDVLYVFQIRRLS